MYQLIFFENAEGCNSMDDILCNPIIKGYAYYDVNKNGEHDSWESRAPNVKIFVSDSIQKLTDLDGRFFISGQPGDNFLISVDLDNKWELTSETDVFGVSLDNNNRIQTIKFGLFPIDSMIDPVLSLTSYTTTCDDEVEFFIRYRNGLEQPFSDCVLRYDSTLEYIGQNSNQNTIFLQNSKLPFGTRDYSIKFKLPNVDSKINLDLLCGSDTFNYSPVVSCNLEVNNVIVMPPGIGDRHFTPIGEPLVYTINFENSGESILEDATIEIDVDENLDVSTLQVLEANDNVETIIKGQHISFIFKNRFLNCNSEFIKGLISYSIEPFSNILDSTVVYCTAKIIIGEDEIIETNTTENTLLKNGAKRIKLHIPIAGTYKEDFIIVNYVDWKDQGIQDANCGTKTYDGHQGTDFSLSSFKEMDEGVDVMAADSGTVIAIHDGEFDRNTAWNVPLGLGNYVAIEHNGKINTYYGHLKKNSLQVDVGDKVVAGQKLGEVGSSGNSTGPHLHFEMWYDSTQVIDPFSGPCGNTDTYWENELPYDDSFRIWETGFLDFNPTFEELFERPEPPVEGNRFFRDLAVDDAKITHWELIHGLLKGDIVKYVWLTPDGTEWFNFDYEIDEDYWHYHGWAYIDLNNTLPLGEWSCNYYVNDSLVGQYPFVVDVWAASEDIAQNEISWYASPNGWTFNATQEGIDNIAIWTVDGKKIYNQKGIHSEKVDIPVFIAKGLYIAQIQLNSGKTISIKIVN